MGKYGIEKIYKLDGISREQMYKKELVIAYLVLVVITVSIMTYVVTQVALLAGITGAISAQGGHLTGANISTEGSSQHWASVFGEINVNSNSNYTYSVSIAPGSTTELNLSLGCVGEELYASTSTMSDWSLITTGTPGLVDSYLLLDGGASESATSMFAGSGSYQVRGNNILAPQTYTLAQGSNPNLFDLGVLNYANTIVMVTSLVADKVGFDGRTHDYQILLPTPAEQTTYYFFSDCEEGAPTPETPPVDGGGGRGKKELIEAPIEELPAEEYPIPSPAPPISPELPPKFEETKEALPHKKGDFFDVIVSIPLKYQQVMQGEEIVAGVNIIKIQQLGIVNVVVDYIIIDAEGKVVATVTETISVDKVLNYLKEIPLPSTLGPGKYTFTVRVAYGSNVAYSSSSFEIIEKPAKKPALFGQAISFTYGKLFSPSILYGMMVVIVMIIIILFLVILLLKRRRKKKKQERN